MNNLRKKIYKISKKSGDKMGFDLPYFIENGFWVLLSQAVNTGAGFIMSIFFARYLSKETFGEYQLIVSIIGILAIFSYTGLNTSILRSVARGYEKSYKTAVNFSFKKSLLAIPIFLLLSVWYYFHEKTDVACVLIFAGLAFAFIQAHNKWFAFWKGKEKFEKTAKQQIIQSVILNSSLILAAVFFSEYLIVTAGTYLVVNAGFNTLWHFKAKHAIVGNKIDEDCIPYGKYMTKMGILSSLILYFDKIIIGFIDLELLAVYGIALKLFDVVKQIIRSFYSVSTPKFAKKKVTIKKQELFIMIIGGILLSGLIYAVSEPIIIYFFTEEYTEAVNIFKKLLFVLPFVFVSPLFAFKANAEKDKSKILKTNILVPAVAIVGSILIFLLTNNMEYFVLSKVFIMQIAFFIVLVPLKSKI